MPGAILREPIDLTHLECEVEQFRRGGQIFSCVQAVALRPRAAADG